jgi:hypothetical protein
MPPNGLIESNHQQYALKEEVEDHDASKNSNHYNHNDSWLSCALASHGHITSKMASTATAALTKKQTIASAAVPTVSHASSQQSMLLESMVSTLNAKLKAQDSELKNIPLQHDRYVELFLKLETAKEQVEYAVYENLQLKRRAKGLEAALAMQDIELDDHSSRRRQQTDAAENTNNNNTSSTGTGTTEGTDENNTANNADAALDEEKQKEDDDMLVKLEQERDMAVKQATALAIQFAESQAAVDDLRDKLVECKVVSEYLEKNKSNTSNNINISSNTEQQQERHQRHQVNTSMVQADATNSSPKMSFFWPRGTMFSSANNNTNISNTPNDDTDIMSVSSISQDSVVRLHQEQRILQHHDEQQHHEQHQPPPSESGSSLDGLDYAPSTSENLEEHVYL